MRDPRRIDQARRLRLAAGCLGLLPVFVDDGEALIAEMFDGYGHLVEVWTWRRV